MAEAPLCFLLRHLQRDHAADPSAPGDAELLQRFVRGHDGSAFEAIVRRHGPMVYNICRRVLRDAHAAEDAFQATFLILARKAASVGRRDALAGWLHRVALRVALRARSRPAALVGAEFPEPAVRDPDSVLWRDLRPVLDEEVARLPEKYRLPVLLCYLSGLTTDEAARRIGIPRGTVLSRLAWARERLRRRLSLRGVAPSAVLLGALPAPEALALPARLAPAAFRGALTVITGQPAAASPAAISLMEGVLRDMMLNKIKNASLVVLALSALGLAAGLWATRPAAAEPGEPKREPPRQAVESHPAKDEGRAPEAPRPVGVWERTMVTKEGARVTLTFRIDAHRLTLTQAATAEGKPHMLFTLEGDYSVSRDYVLYGFLTGIDPAEGMEMIENAGRDISRFLDQPFSIRYRVDETALTIRDIKVGGVNDADHAELQLLGGRYKKKLAKDEK